MKIQSINKNTSGDKYSIKQGYEYTGDNYWDWWIWIEASEENLDKIESVVYNLHYTFINPVRTIKTRENKFMLSTSGWGTFTIYARLNFKDSTVLQLTHNLELYYENGEKNEQ